MRDLRWPTADGCGRPSADELRYLLRRAVVSVHARTVYVPTPKVASTSMRWALAAVEGLSDARAQRGDRAGHGRPATMHDLGVSRLLTLGLLKQHELDLVLTSPDWLRIGMTRDPYARLVSGWKDRVVLGAPTTASDRTSEDVPWPPSLDPDGTYDLRNAFRTFVRTLGTADGPDRADRHLWPQVRFLASESVAYTHLLDVSSMPTLLDVIADRAGVDGLTVPEENPGLPIDVDALYDPETRSTVERVYERDFEQLGYAIRAIPDRSDELRLDTVSVTLVARLRECRVRVRDLRLVVEGRTGIQGSVAELRHALTNHRQNRAAAVSQLAWPTVPDVRRPTDAEMGYLLRNALAIPRAHVVYVPTPKVATTSLKLGIAAIDGIPESRMAASDRTARSRPGTIHDPQVLRLPRLGTCSMEALREMLTSEAWMRVAVTRDPYSRLASAWLHRIFLIAPAAALTRPDAWDDGANADGTFDLARAFRAFVDRLVQPGCPDRADPHFSPQVDVLALGAMPYNLVVDVGSIGELIGTIGERAGVPGLTLPRYNESLPIDARALYDRETALKVRDFYREDFARFGYDTTLIAPDESCVLSETATALAQELQTYHRRIAELSAVARERTGTKGAAMQLRRATLVRFRTALRHRQHI